MDTCYWCGHKFTEEQCENDALQLVDVVQMDKSIRTDLVCTPCLEEEG